MAGKSQALNLLYVTNRDDWRKWLEENHAKARDVWLIYYKKHTGTPRIPYDDAVEEALLRLDHAMARRLDDERFAQRFTPRTNTTNWSELNRGRLGEMIAAGKMTEAGLGQGEPSATRPHGAAKLRRFPTSCRRLSHKTPPQRAT